MHQIYFRLPSFIGCEHDIWWAQVKRPWRNKLPEISSLGWILKNGLFTERLGPVISLPYELNYISWINSIKGKIPAGKHFTFNISLGPRIEYLLTG
ncbi:MAG: hypothetical protein ABIR06_04230 [Cyclobacteriaceae bacterium]